MERELLAAIYENPDDEAPQIVLADVLLGLDDPRGELILLDRRDRAGELASADGIDRLLLLAAHYGFPSVRPPDEPLPKRQNGLRTQYTLWHGRKTYLVECVDGVLTMEVNGGWWRRGDRVLGPHQIFPVSDRSDRRGGFGEWTAKEERFYLTLISDALRAATPLDELYFPSLAGELPQYLDVPLRAYQIPDDFTAPRGLDRFACGLAARDYHRWHALWGRLRGLPADT
jgi:uncharacterized protein (TIGR02996 family)